MGKHTRKLFGSAIVSGITLRLGLPGLADLVDSAWDTARDPLSELAPRTVISLASLAVFLVVVYLTFDIYLKGARRGTRGLRAVAAGIICGFLIGSLFLGALTQTLEL